MPLHYLACLCTNTRACKQVSYHRSICLSCKICWILLSQNIWTKKLTMACVFVDEHRPFGLSITGEKFIIVMWSKGNEWHYHPNGEVPYGLLSRNCFYCPNLIRNLSNSPCTMTLWYELHQAYSELFSILNTSFFEVYVGIFRIIKTFLDIETLLKHVQAYSGIFNTLCNLCIFTTLTYPGIFQTGQKPVKCWSSIFRTLP